MADFKKVIPFTLQYEGGYCDVPGDKGGPTKYGIALYTYAKGPHDLRFLDKNKDGKITKIDIQNLSKEDAVNIYYHNYWNTMHLDKIKSDKCAFVIFDALVNHGKGGATKLLQRTCNSMGSKLTVDSAFGPLTEAEMIKQTKKVNEFCDMFMLLRRQYFANIVANNPSQNKFLKGWLNRCLYVERDLRTLTA